MKAFVPSIAFACFIAASLSAFSANPLVTEETGKLLASLVRSAQDYDLYNARCRGNAASTKIEDSNRLFLNKYRLTVNQVINRYMGEDDRAAKAAMEQNFLEKLSALGGCKAAKRKGLLKEIDRNYRELSQQVADLP